MGQEAQCPVQWCAVETAGWNCGSTDSALKIPQLRLCQYKCNQVHFIPTSFRYLFSRYYRRPNSRRRPLNPESGAIPRKGTEPSLKKRGVRMRSGCALAPMSDGVHCISLFVKTVILLGEMSSCGRSCTINCLVFSRILVLSILKPHGKAGELSQL